MKLKNLLLFSLVFLFMAGCGKKGNNEIKIGAILPLTGQGAQIGVLSNDAVNLAVDIYNGNKTENEPQLTVISEDDQLNPKLSISAFQKLTGVDNIKVIIGPITSGSTLALAPLANEKKILIISTGASGAAISNAGDYIFRVELSDQQGGIIQAELAYDSLNYKKVATVFVNNEYGQGLSRVFNNKFKELGGEILLNEGFPEGSTNFRTILTKIKQLNIDAIFFVFNTEVIPFVKQKAEMNIKSKFFTTPVFENQSYINNLGTLAEGITYIYYGTFNQSKNDSLSIAFTSEMKNKFNKEPDYYAALAYDATNIIIQSLKKNNFNIGDIKSELYKVKNFPGVTGNITFDSNGDVNKPVTLKTVKEGKFVKYR